MDDPIGVVELMPVLEVVGMFDPIVDMVELVGVTTVFDEVVGVVVVLVALEVNPSVLVIVLVVVADETDGIVLDVAEGVLCVVLRVDGIVDALVSCALQPVTVTLPDDVGTVPSVVMPDRFFLGRDGGSCSMIAVIPPVMISASTTRNGIHGNPRRAGTSICTVCCGDLRRGLSGLTLIAPPHSRQNSCPRSTGALHSGQEPPMPTPIDAPSPRSAAFTANRRPHACDEMLHALLPYGPWHEPWPWPSA